jgi:hypothetical protein
MEVIIKNEREAWDWLETVSDESFAFKEPVDISFDGCPLPTQSGHPSP